MVVNYMMYVFKGIQYPKIFLNGANILSLSFYVIKTLIFPQIEFLKHTSVFELQFSTN